MLTFLLGVSVGYSQEDVGVISGKLTDKQLNEPISNHTLTLNIHTAGDVAQRKTTTNANGEYRFENLPIHFQTHFSITTNYNGFDYEEKNIVLSSLVPSVSVNIGLQAFTDDQSHIKIKSYTIVLGPAPDDPQHEGALSVIEAFQIENSSDMVFRTTHNEEKVGIYLSLPDGYEDFEPRAPESLKIDTDTEHVVLTEPLSPGITQIGFTYVIRGKETTLDLSRAMRFHTDEISIFVPDGINLVPNPKIFASVQRQPIHTAIYTIYGTSTSEGFPIDKEVDLSLEISAPGSVAKSGSNVGQLIFIAIAAALAGGFLAAAIFTLRGAKNKPAETDTSQAIQPDVGWLRKLNNLDLDSARTARLEFITLLDDLQEKQGISDRVYNRLRKEQTQRLTEILDALKERGIDD